jgi:hypothetical protein
MNGPLGQVQGNLCFSKSEAGSTIAHVMTLGLEQLDHMAIQSGNVQ